MTNNNPNAYPNFNENSNQEVGYNYTDSINTVTQQAFYDEQSGGQNPQFLETHKQVDFSLPTTFEDYLVFSKNFYAGFWSRVVAYLIDLIAILCLSSLLNTFSFGLLNIQLDFPIIGSEGLSYVIVMFVYFILMTYYFSQTLGKIIMKIKVETNKGEKLTWADVIYRELVGRLLNMAFFYIPYLVLAFTPKKKGLHDYIADTVVVKEDFSEIRKKMNAKLAEIN